ncbi:Hypothetical predicted protein [Pelobates cultripes]|uniref:Uncharacterized protein n=1 Tax=Pelobates cultripes TaxID=61616 RepID=A0AAD1S0L6_PELCU|nr:Hypothetical predicted protein [Pelobates cultripes]
MADGSAVHLEHETISNWAAAFQAKFDVVCQKFCELWEEKNQSPAPKLIAMASNPEAPPQAQPRRPSTQETSRVRAHSTAAQQRPHPPQGCPHTWPPHVAAQPRQKKRTTGGETEETQGH